MGFRLTTRITNFIEIIMLKERINYKVCKLYIKSVFFICCLSIITTTAFGQVETVAEVVKHVERRLCSSHLLPIDLNQALGINFQAANGAWYDEDGRRISNIFVFGEGEPESEYRFYYDAVSSRVPCIKGPNLIKRYRLTLSIDKILMPEGDTVQYFCYYPDAPIKVGDLAVYANTESVRIYASKDEKEWLSEDVVIEQGKIYYASILSLGCGESDERLPIRAEAEVIPDLSISSPVYATGTSFDLSLLKVIDANNSPGSYTYHSAMPDGPDDVRFELPSNTISKPQVVYVMKETANGCWDVAAVDVYVYDRLPIPDGFSPNGDDVNDLFVIEGLGILYPDAQMKILNRWGVEIYSKDQYGNENTWGANDAWWNGTTTHKWKIDNIVDKGAVLPVGTYFYILKLTPDGDDVITGTIFLNK